MFIILTTLANQKIRINVQHLMYYFAVEKHTRMAVSAKDTFEIKESPEQIDTMLREQFVTVFERTNNEA